LSRDVTFRLCACKINQLDNLGDILTFDTLAKPALTFALLVAVLGPSPAAFGADDFKSACDLYASHDYKAALPLFTNVSKKYPANPTAHYYLAHTYLALGQKGAARTEYQSCIDCKPSPEVNQQCAKALASLGSSGGSSGSGAASAAALPDGAKPLSIQEAKLEQDKQWIQRTLQDKLDKLKKEEDEALGVVAANANQRFRLPDGTRVWRDPQGTAAVKADFEERMKQAREDARKKIEGLH
jgi:tetratricopeptide (TPR) repeat protein